MKAVAAVVLGVVVSAASAYSQTTACDALTGRQRETAQGIMSGEYLYDCCDETIEVCLQAEPTCALAVRIADNVCRRVAAGQDEERIRRALSRRARSMVGGGVPAEVSFDGAPAVGPDDAPVIVVAYACARCPYCSRLIPELYEAVVNGVMKGKVRLVFRIFPIRGHEGSTEAGLAFSAAAAMHRFWPYMLYSYRHFDSYSADLRSQWAEAAGLDPALFAARLEDPATRETLVASKKEGLVNGVEETPTLFINGRRWVGDLEIAELVDAIGEESQRIRGVQWSTE